MYRKLEFKKLLILGLYVLYAWFCWMMLDIFLQYIPYNTDVAFLGIKQDEIKLLYYKIAFFTHVYTSLLVLPAGFIQFSDNLRLKFRSLHRRYGWIYTITILGFAAPSGLIMALYANGGIVSQLAFSLLAILWFYTTLKAVLEVRKGNYYRHRQFMIRSFALSLSAITLRMWKFILVALFHPHPMDVYQVVAWLGWVLNLLIAELIIYKYIKP